jgi:hypothetical protein
VDSLIAGQKIKCPEKCGKRVRRRSMDNHAKYSCKARIVEEQKMEEVLVQSDVAVD